MSEREKKIELLLQTTEAFATPFLEQGRGGWDLAHTKAVVYYAGLLAESERRDLPVLQIAAWLHDIGYFSRFEGDDSGDYEAVKERKALHMAVGAEKAKEFLQRDDIKLLLTVEQRERIVHLVEVHDNLKELNAIDEIIIMEADTLGAIDLDRVLPSFDREGLKKYILGLKERRQLKFVTRLGIELLGRLLPKFEEYDPGH